MRERCEKSQSRPRFHHYGEEGDKEKPDGVFLDCAEGELRKQLPLRIGFGHSALLAQLRHFLTQVINAVFELFRGPLIGRAGRFETGKPAARRTHNRSG